MRARSFLGSVLSLAAASCVPPPRMCALELECGGQASCVAGRCVARGAAPAIGTARRQLHAPTQVGWVRRGGDAGGDVAVLGRGDDAVVFLGFDVPLAQDAAILEAYVILERAGRCATAAAPLALHAVRVATAWDVASLSWGHQPVVEEIGAPVTMVAPSGGPLIRVDVLALARRWLRRASPEFGVAIVAEGSAGGLALALAPQDGAEPSLALAPTTPPQSPSAADPRQVDLAAVGAPGRQLAGPRLELYLR